MSPRYATEWPSVTAPNMMECTRSLPYILWPVPKANILLSGLPGLATPEWGFMKRGGRGSPPGPQRMFRFAPLYETTLRDGLDLALDLL